MKYFVTISFLVLGLCSVAQSRKIAEVLGDNYELEDIVCRAKDSVKLESLLASIVSYQNFDGKVESRQEAIRDILHDKAVYTKALKPTPYETTAQGDSVIVKNVFKGIEKKEDGSQIDINVTIEDTWIKEKKDWKLAIRTVTKN